MAKKPGGAASAIARKPARASKRKTAETSLDWLNTTDDELFQKWLTQIRQRIKAAITPFAEGPLRQTGDFLLRPGDFWLNLGDGDQLFRPKDSLTANQKAKLKFLQCAATETVLGEEEYYEPDCAKLILLRVGLRVGMFLERAKVVISTDNLGGGRTKLLTDDQVIQVRLAREKGRTVPALCKDYDVGKDTIYRALRGDSQK